MHLRLAEERDLPACAELAAQAMLDDELFAITCPKRHEFYADYRDSFFQRHRLKFLSPGYVFVVAVEEFENIPDFNGDREDRIVGYAAWERTGEDPAAQQWKSPNEGWWNGQY